MAVVQISKIQVRRGLKNGATGIPQLSNGEFAWAVDSQELFIGNGAINEGAPEVGNTKILTEHDNLLEFLETYRFSQTDPAFTASIERTFQTKLDEYVSVKDFGAKGDGIVNDTTAFQNALTALFRNANTGYRKKLYIPTGVYKISSALYIPSNAVIEGESKVNTVINLTQNVAFETSTGTRPGSFSTGNVPTNISISNLTFNTTTNKIDITSVTNATFTNVIFKGSYNLTNGVVTATPAVSFNNTVFSLITDKIKFNSCLFNQTAIGISGAQTGTFTTNFEFNDCEFDVCYKAIFFTGTLNQINRWYFTRCNFSSIHTQAVHFTNGTGSNIYKSNFVSCGNGINNDTLPAHPIVKFDQIGNNNVDDCQFSRTQTVLDNISSGTVSIPEVLNGKVSLLGTYSKNIVLTNAPLVLAVFSSSVSTVELDYTLKLGTNVRTGTVTVSGDIDLQTTVITDNYSYTSGSAAMEGFIFESSNEDQNSDSIRETLMIRYRNPTATGIIGTISFAVRYSV